MKDILFIGPVDMAFGPGIKNTYTVECLKKEYSVNVLNTYHQKKLTNIKNLASFIFSKKRTVIAVSSGGRALLLPIAYFKKKLFKKYEYSIIAINGYIIQEFSTKNRIKNFLMLNSLKKAEKVFVEVEGLKKNLEEIYGVENVIWFPNFKPDKDYVSYENTANYNKFNNDRTLKCVFLSRVSLVKGIDIAINAIKELIDDGVNISLDIYGPISDEAKDIILSIEYEKSINYVGNIPNHQVTKELSKYNLFLFPTRHKREGFPAALIDAFSASLPVISSNISYNKEIIVDKENGLICEENTFEALKKSIMYFIDDSSKINIIGKTNYILSQEFKMSVVFRNFMQEIIDCF